MVQIRPKWDWNLRRERWCWSPSGRSNQTKMGLKSRAAFHTLRSSVGFKSDQNGIEMLRRISTTRRLFRSFKSDQNGIEMPLSGLLVFFFAMFKSDQNGIEIFKSYIGIPCLEKVQIRPKWDWNQAEARIKLSADIPYV